MGDKVTGFDALLEDTAKYVKDPLDCMRFIEFICEIEKIMELHKVVTAITWSYKTRSWYRLSTETKPVWDLSIQVLDHEIHIAVYNKFIRMKLTNYENYITYVDTNFVGTDTLTVCQREKLKGLIKKIFSSEIRK